jgi:thioredoxin reductase
MLPDRFEAVILGGGPAGLSAGLVLGRCLRQTLVCDDGRYRNQCSRALHCFMGHDGADPAELLASSRRQLARYETVILANWTASFVERAGGSFVVHLEGGGKAITTALLVATGVADELPPLDGITSLFGRSVHVCPYCDGWEHRQTSVAAYGRGEKGAIFANMLRQWTGDLVLCTHGEALERGIQDKLRARGIRINSKPIRRLDGEDGRLASIVFEDGEVLERKALFFTTGQHPRSPLLERLGCRYDEKGGFACDPDGRTNVEGVYVAGDVSRDVQLAVIAAAEGARAGLAINKYLIDPL